MLPQVPLFSLCTYVLHLLVSFAPPLLALESSTLVPLIIHMVISLFSNLSPFLLFYLLSLCLMALEPLFINLLCSLSIASVLYVLNLHLIYYLSVLSSALFSCTKNFIVFKGSKFGIHDWHWMWVPWPLLTMDLCSCWLDRELPSSHPCTMGSS